MERRDEHQPVLAEGRKPQLYRAKGEGVEAGLQAVDGQTAEGGGGDRHQNASGNKEKVCMYII